MRHPSASPASVVAQRYARFASEEAPGRSSLYEQWAAGVAATPAVAAVIGRLAENRRQPPLVFAITRLLGAPEGAFDDWARWLIENADIVADEATRRSLQTNEPLRCAALLPALSSIEGPIALLEIGASAGLCLVPDRYSYRYSGGINLDPPAGISPVILECHLTGRPPLQMPEIVWRRGIDLTPLDASNANDQRFLASLVWPGESGRVDRIAAALQIAADAALEIEQGDATDAATLARAAAAAPRDATLVITTPGVLPHIPRAGRESLISAIRALRATWITIDPPGLHDEWAQLPAARWDGFVLALDGEPLAAVDPLGASVEWRAGAHAVAG
ncbi:DUF2332 family protein (plasmid) [Coraliomargarita sp. W4R53]